MVWNATTSVVRKKQNLSLSEIFTEQQYISNGIVINEGDCIFDVGANIGLFSLFVSRLQKNLKIYAFEPIESIFEVLQENVHLHSLHNIFLFNYGLSSENNPEKLFTFYPNMAGNSTTKPLEKLEQRDAMNAVLSQEKVEYFFQSDQVKGELRTLSSVINELDIKSIDLLKIDVEGEEYEVLKGIEEKDWSKIKQVFAEVHDREGRLEQIQTLLTNHGFDITIEKNNLLPPTTNNLNLYAVRN
ncbi:MAG: FkbM family methyltransferase [Xenococcaceae cyanobacterium MO_167.B27]|nr:FkbM family methyltransferase [Xenococcaceae cyanobacterium MO_167.B27]